jgi:aldehyde dehydrogenase (NAD+)
MTASTASQTVQGEDRMLVGAVSGARYDNVDPATEEVLGQTADTDRALRKRCLEQLHQALQDENWTGRWKAASFSRPG